MPVDRYVRPTVSAPPAMPPLLMPQPPIAPLVPPTHTVDLMTTGGSLGCVWCSMESARGQTRRMSGAVGFHARIQNDIRHRATC